MENTAINMEDECIQTGLGFDLLRYGMMTDYTSILTQRIRYLLRFSLFVVTCICSIVIIINIKLLIYLENQFDNIDAKFSAQAKIDLENIRQEFEHKVVLLRHEVEEEVYKDYCKKVRIGTNTFDSSHIVFV